MEDEPGMLEVGSLFKTANSRMIVGPLPENCCFRWLGRGVGAQASSADDAPNDPTSQTVQ